MPGGRELTTICQHLSPMYSKVCLHTNCTWKMLLIHPIPAAGFNGPAMLIIVNLLRCSTCHLDPEDDEMCILIIFGQFSGGDIVLPAFGMTFEIPGGTIFILRSRYLEHFNTPWMGLRFSVVLTCRVDVVTHFQTPPAAATV